MNLTTQPLKNIPVILLLAGSFIFLATKMLPKSTKAQNNVDVLLSPPTQVLYAGDSFTVAVQIQAGTETLDSANAYLNFDPAKLKVITMTPGTTLPDAISSAYNNDLGQIDYTATLSAATASGTFDLVSIQFQAMAESSATAITFSQSTTRETTVALAATSIPINVNQSTVTATSPIIINELMINPDAVTDANGEWIELYNPTANSIDLDGCVVKDNGNNSHTIDNSGSLIISAGGYLVLARNGNSSENGGVTVDYVGSFVLANSADEIILGCNGIEYDRVEYDSSFPIVAGASMQLIDPTRDNNIGGNWCESTTAWPGSAGDLGTPGTANDCPSTAITLVNFAAVQGSTGVTVTWETGTEIDNAGFNLHRATAKTGPYTKINPTLIPAKGDAVSGASYLYRDNVATDPNQTYYYKLEDIDTNTASTFHGPVNTASDVSGSPDMLRVYLPVIFK